MSGIALLRCGKYQRFRGFQFNVLKPSLPSTQILFLLRSLIPKTAKRAAENSMIQIMHHPSYVIQM